jgi:regulator of replication initiation timing
LLLGACTSCHLLKSDLEDSAVEIILLKGKLFHATKENTELKQEVAYLTSRLDRTVVSEKMIEDDLSRVEESATKSTYKFGVGFEGCENKAEKSPPKFIPTSNYHKEEETIKSTKIHYPSNPKTSFNPKREVWKETTKPRAEDFVCMFCGRVGHLDEFCFHRKRIEKKCFDYARNSYRNEFTDYPPHSYSRAPSHFSYGPNHR